MEVKNSFRRGFWVCAMASLLLAGCGSSDTPSPTAEPTPNVINLNTVNGVVSNPKFSDLTTKNADGTLKNGSSTDIMWMDAKGSNNRLYETDRGATNAATATTFQGRVWVIDADTSTVLFPITGFYGKHAAVAPVTNNSGPNGVTVANDTVRVGNTGAKELWVGDGDHSLRWADLNVAGTPVIGGAIDVGGSNRADELAYDPDHDLILIGSDAETPVFMTFINRDTKTIAGYIKFDKNTPKGKTDVSLMTAPTGATLATAGHGPNATNGIEQPMYDPGLHFFYQAVPATTENPNGEIDQIDPVAMKVTARYPFTDFCTPHGLSLGPSHHIAVACGDKVNMRSVIMDVTPGASAGTILANITDAGGSDMAWFNPGDNNYYFGCGSNLGPPDGKTVFPSIAVVNASTNTYVRSFATGSSKNGRQVTVNPGNNLIFTPIDDIAPGGIGVFK